MPKFDETQRKNTYRLVAALQVVASAFGLLADNQIVAVGGAVTAFAALLMADRNVGA